MTAGDTSERIEALLRERLAPIDVALADESAMHAGHAGAASGGGHFRLRIVSARFVGLSRVARHRLVYDSLFDLMRHAIHALAIEALTPDEAGPAQPSPVAAAGTPAR